MAIDTVQFHHENSSSSSSEANSIFSKGIKVFSSALVFYCAMQLLDSSIVTLKEIFYPEMLSAEEKFDIEQANLEWELLYFQAESINPIEIAKYTFFLINYLSKVMKVNRLTSSIRVNSSIKERILSSFKSAKNRLLHPFGSFSVANRVASVDSSTTLDEVQNCNELVRNQLASQTRSNDPIKIATAAFDVADLVIPHPSITVLVEAGKMLSELKNLSEQKSKLDDSKNIFAITGHASKAMAEFTSFPILGKVFGQIALTTSSVLKILDKEKAA